MDNSIFKEFKRRWLSSEETADRLVISHDHCNDGAMTVIGAVDAVFNSYIDKEIGVRFSSYSEGHGTASVEQYEDLIESCRGKLVLIADFSFSLAVTKKMIEVADLLVVLDHHKSAVDIGLGQLPEVYLDMNRCGAKLTYDFLYEQDDIPEVIKYVEDFDLGKFKEGLTTDAVNLYLRSYRQNLYEQINKSENKTISKIEEELTTENFIKNLIKSEWMVIAEYTRASNVKAAAKLTTEFIIKGERFVGGNSTRSATGVLTEVYRVHGCRALSYTFKKDKLIISFRSPSEDLPVDKIAQSLGGGGHICASGVALELNEKNMHLIYRFLINNIID